MDTWIAKGAKVKIMAGEHKGIEGIVVYAHLLDATVCYDVVLTNGYRLRGCEDESLAILGLSDDWVRFYATP